MLGEGTDPPVECQGESENAELFRVLIRRPNADTSRLAVKRAPGDETGSAGQNSSKEN
jgi:hypothetical protein